MPASLMRTPQRTSSDTPLVRSLGGERGEVNVLFEGGEAYVEEEENFMCLRLSWEGRRKGT